MIRSFVRTQNGPLLHNEPQKMRETLRRCVQDAACTAPEKCEAEHLIKNMSGCLDV